jgi:hypothetical protein
VLFSDRIAQLVCRIFPAQQGFIPVTVDEAAEMLSDLGADFDAPLMKCVRVISAPFFLSGELVLLRTRLQILRQI